MTIRRQPADFVVMERAAEAFVAGLRAERSGAATHAVYELEKRSLTTPEAVGRFAAAVGVRPGEVDYAGLKDKHALTRQLVSAPLGETPRAKEAAGQGFSASFRGWSVEPVTAESIDGNRFEIVVRDLSEQASGEMARRADLLRADGSLLVVNYFGAQRFGSARHGEGFVAARLIRGDFEGALRLAIGTPARKDSGKTRRFTRGCAAKWGDWKALAAELPKCPERRAIETLAGGGDFKAAIGALPNFTQQMCAEAYQSHLWNGAARRLAERIVREGAERLVAAAIGGAGAPDRFKPPTALRADDEFGLMLFPPASLVDSGWRSVVMPVLGPKTAMHEPWGSAAGESLAAEGIRQEALRIPGMRRPFFGEADRGLFAAAERFEMSPAEKDEFSGGKRLKRTVRFDLGRGAYATVVLRALGQ